MSSKSSGAQSAGVRMYGWLPPAIRQRFVRAVMPSFTVGTMTAVLRQDGAVLLVRHSYTANWNLPGGLLNRRERPEVGAARETREEVGVRILLVGEPAVTVDPFRQVVRVIYRARLADGVEFTAAKVASPEIVEVGWFLPDELPTLSPESTEALRSLERIERQRR